MFGLTHPCDASVIIKCLGNILAIARTILLINTITRIAVIMLKTMSTKITQNSSNNMIVMLHTMHL